MSENKKFFGKRKAGVRLGFVVALVIGLVTGYMTFPHPMLVQDENTKSWHVIWEGSLAQAAENTTIAAGNSGIMEVFICEHSATPTTTFGNAAANGTGLEDDTLGDTAFTNANATQINIPYGTYFDIVVRVRANATNAKNGRATWWHTDLKVEIGSDAVLSPQISYPVEMLPAGYGTAEFNTTTFGYLYLNYYVQGAGSGYTIGKGATAEITHIKFSWYG